MSREESHRRLMNLRELEGKFRESREALQWAKGASGNTTQPTRLREDRDRLGSAAASLSTIPSLGSHSIIGGATSGFQSALHTPSTLTGLEAISNPFVGHHLGANPGTFSPNNLARASLQDLYNNRMLSNALPGMAGATPGNLRYAANLASLMNPASRFDLNLGLSPSLGQLADLQQLRNMQYLPPIGYRGNIPLQHQHQLGSSLSAAGSALPNMSAMNSAGLLSQGLISRPFVGNHGTSIGAANAAAPGPSLTNAAAAGLYNNALPPQQDPNDDNSLAEQALKRRIQESLDIQEAASKRPKGGS